MATPNSNSPCYKVSNSLHVFKRKHTFYVPSDIWLTNACENFGFETVEKEFPYWKSPYKNFVKDHISFLLLALRISNNQKFSFWKNIMNVVFKK